MPFTVGIAIFLFFSLGILKAAESPADAALTEPEGSAALLYPEQTDVVESGMRLVEFGSPMAGTQATWQLPATYSQRIGPVSVLQIRPDTYMLTVDGNNVAVTTGWQATVVVGASSIKQCDALVAAIKKIAKAPIRYIVNTSADANRVGCNELLARAGRSFTPRQQGNFSAAVLAHGNVLQRLAASTAEQYSDDALPSETFNRPVFNMYLNNQAIQLFWMPNAHTDGDTITMLRRSDVVIVGDILDTTRFPVINLAHGGTIDGEIAALNRLLDEFAVAVSPKFQHPGGTLIIPGRGQLCTPVDVLNYRDMITIIRDRVKVLVDRGVSLEAVQQSNPARGYSARYGTKKGDWTTADFVAAVYQSLQTTR